MIYFQAMRKYELTIVLDAKTSPAKRKAVRQDIEKTITVFKGKLGTVLEWGEKELAYRIGKANKGFLIHFPLQLTPDAAKKFIEKIKTEDVILRYLFTEA
jgi:ribosomal protein S6